MVENPDRRRVFLVVTRDSKVHGFSVDPTKNFTSKDCRVKSFRLRRPTSFQLLRYKIYSGSTRTTLIQFIVRLFGTSFPDTRCGKYMIY